MDIGLFGEWLDVIYKIAMAAFGIWLYLDRRNDKTHLRISQLEERIDNRLDGHSDRLTRVETALTNQPTHDHLAEIYREIRKVTDAVSAMSATLERVHERLDNVKELTSRMDSFWRQTTRG
jgi:phage shock protein A